MFRMAFTGGAEGGWFPAPGPAEVRMTDVHGLGMTSEFHQSEH